MEPSTGNAGRWAELRTRTLAAIPLVAGVLLALWLGGFWFVLLILLAALIMVREWDALVAGEAPAWRVAGLAYVALPCLALIWLRVFFVYDPLTYRPDGFYIVLWLLLAVWACDIGAYFAGRLIGGPKIAPSISPKKTWAGLAGGMLAAGLAGAAGANLVHFPSTLPGCFALAALLAIIAQIGDFFESWLKRRAGVKDSGTPIPGHGGLLDRVDGLITSAPVYALCVAVLWR